MPHRYHFFAEYYYASDGSVVNEPVIHLHDDPCADDDCPRVHRYIHDDDDLVLAALHVANERPHLSAVERSRLIGSILHHLGAGHLWTHDVGAGPAGDGVDDADDGRGGADHVGGRGAAGAHRSSAERGVMYTNVYSDHFFAEIEDAVDDLFVEVLQDDHFTHTSEHAIGVIFEWAPCDERPGMKPVARHEVAIDWDGTWRPLAEVPA